jgi:hypothetical protein
MTTSPNEPLEYGSPRDDDVDKEAANEGDERLVEDETELAAGGYDDRQDDLTESDRDLFERKEQDPDARYKPEDEPLSEPRHQPRQAD